MGVLKGCIEEMYCTSSTTMGFPATNGDNNK